MSKSQEKPLEKQNLLIIGSGPAGLSAAIYAARADLKPLVLTGLTLYGQASVTDIIENYPGFPDGVGGAELGQLLQEQAEKFGAEIVMDQVISVDLGQRPFRVETYGKSYETQALIIATGADHRKLGIPGEQALTGRGVSYCGTCDGWFFKDKDIVVIGGGDSALEEGLFLTRFANSVTVIHRRDELRGGALLQKRAFKNPKIKFIWDTVVTEILGEEAVNAVRLKKVKTGTEEIQETEGVFIFIGHTPNSKLFDEFIEMDDQGYLAINKYYETNIPGVFAAGEIADPNFRQVVTSTGMGAAAAIQATRYLENLA